MQTPWDHRYAQRMQRMKSSAIRELLKFAEKPEIISFAGGMPAPELFPKEKLLEACRKALLEDSKISLQYGSSEGYEPLREMISRHTARYGIDVGIDNIMITSGSQQALDLLGKVFINRGDRILCETPTYLGALQAWNSYGADYITNVPSDDDGIMTDKLYDAMRYGPKFMYVLPNFHNPCGTTIPLDRRLKLIEIADHFGVPIIEDDPYGQLRFEGEHIPSIVQLDSQMQQKNGGYTGNVIYLSTFSKILAPGLRLGWVIAPKEVISKLVMAKQGADLHTATFNQVVAYEVSRHGFIDEHVKKIVAVYKERRDVMLESLEENMPEGVHWTHPKGGLFLWATLPECIDTTQLLATALEQNVAFVPGTSFFANGGGQNTMRLNFSMMPPERINEGIARLGKVIKKELT